MLSGVTGPHAPLCWTTQDEATPFLRTIGLEPRLDEHIAAQPLHRPANEVEPQSPTLDAAHVASAGTALKDMLALSLWHPDALIFDDDLHRVYDAPHLNPYLLVASTVLYSVRQQLYQRRHQLVAIDFRHKRRLSLRRGHEVQMDGTECSIELIPVQHMLRQLADVYPLTRCGLTRLAAFRRLHLRPQPV